MTIIDRVINDFTVEELKLYLKAHIERWDCPIDWELVKYYHPSGYCDERCNKCWNREYKED